MTVTVLVTLFLTTMGINHAAKVDTVQLSFVNESLRFVDDYAYSQLQPCNDDGFAVRYEEGITDD